MNEGFCLILLAVENTCHIPLAAIDRPFSTYFIGACISVSSISRFWFRRPGLVVQTGKFLVNKAGPALQLARRGPSPGQRAGTSSGIIWGNVRNQAVFQRIGDSGAWAGRTASRLAYPIKMV